MPVYTGVVLGMPEGPPPDPIGPKVAAIHEGRRGAADAKAGRPISTSMATLDGTIERVMADLVGGGRVALTRDLASAAFALESDLRRFHSGESVSLGTPLSQLAGLRDSLRLIEPLIDARRVPPAA
jgi:hypothetical protein